MYCALLLFIVSLLCNSRWDFLLLYNCYFSIFWLTLLHSCLPLFSPASGRQHSACDFYEIICFGFHIWVKSLSACLSVTWIILLTTVISSSIYTFTNNRMPWLTSGPLCIYTFSLSIHHLMDTYDCYSILGIGKHTAMKLWDCHFKILFIFPLDIFKALRLLDDMGNSVCNFLRNLHSVFHNRFTHLHAYQYCSKIPFHNILNSTCDLLSFYNSHSYLVRWYLIVILICIWLVTSDADHDFLLLLDFCKFF
jgi:hypothetical protein